MPRAALVARPGRAGQSSSGFFFCPTLALFPLNPQTVKLFAGGSTATKFFPTIMEVDRGVLEDYLRFGVALCPLPWWLEGG